LFGAADQFIAVHERHDEIAEKEVDGSREGTGDCVECVLWIGQCNYSIASGFEEESSDGEDLLIVVNAENGLLGAHGFSVLPAVPQPGFRTGSMRYSLADWASSARLLVGKACRWAALCSIRGPRRWFGGGFWG
jgi:hypothetical protein